MVQNPESYIKSARKRNHERNIDRILRKLNFFPRGTSYDRVLDIACGTGMSAKPYLEFSNELHLLDASPEMLNASLSMKATKTKIIRKLHNFEEKLPFSNNYFDVVQSIHGIDSSPVFKEVIFFGLVNEARRVARKNGRILIVIDPTCTYYVNDVLEDARDYTSSWEKVFSTYLDTSNICKPTIVSLRNRPEYLGIYFRK